MLWVPENFQSADTEGKRTLRRGAPLTFGMFGGLKISAEEHDFVEAGSGILTHAFSGITAKHVGDYLVRTLDGRDKIPKYSFRTEHSATIFQHINPLEEHARNSLWHVTHAWSSPITDIAVIQIAAGDAPHHDPRGYFPWRLLPPPVGAKVYMMGFPRFKVLDEGETFAIKAQLKFQPAMVTNVYRLRRPDGAPKHPCFEVDAAVDEGFSGGPVIFEGSLCGLVSVSSTFEEKTWCSTLWPLALLEHEGDFPGSKTRLSDLLDRNIIPSVDWRDVRDRIAKRENDIGESYAFIEERNSGPSNSIFRLRC